jgi:hypothetical protein
VDYCNAREDKGCQVWRDNLPGVGLDRLRFYTVNYDHGLRFTHAMGINRLGSEYRDFNDDRVFYIVLGGWLKKTRFQKSKGEINRSTWEE